MTVHTNFLLSEILYYQIGGRAQFVLEVHNQEDLLRAFEFVQDQKIEKVLPVGLGSNLLVSDEEFKGAVIWFSKPDEELIERSSNGKVKAFASCLLDDLIQFSFRNNLRGLEWAGGLPSTVGGAIRGNVGAFGSEIKDSVLKAKVIDLSFENFNVQEFTNSALQFSYRDSFLKRSKNLLIVEGVFQLQETDEKGIEGAQKIYSAHIEHRKKNNPIEYPSCGSVFKNIRDKEQVAKILEKWEDVNEKVSGKWHGKVAMGYVIKRLGFSGFRVGGAEVSEKHANYIINKDRARFADVLAIIEKVKERFYQEFFFYPELEVEIVS